MTLIITGITIIYLLLIGSFIIGFDKVKPFISHNTEAKTTFSIIIPFKNEAENLSDLLESISNLNYPKNLFEVILVNDESDDEFETIISNFLSKTQNDIRVINNERKTNSPKKDAINKAILKAKFDWIVTTDADCIIPKYWLNTFNDYILNNKTSFIVAPVAYHKIDSFLKRFQTLDFLSLIGATIGGFGIKKPFLCNGANLAYKKTIFNKLNGFDGNSNIASGDDIFLLEKAIKLQPEHVHYLKSEYAILETKPQPDFRSLLSQRIRWAAKTSSYNNWYGKIAGIIVLLMNASIICSLLFAIIGIISFKFLGCIFIIKLGIDFFLIFKTSRFFKQEKYLRSYLLSGLLYPFFSVYVALTSVFKGYKWKGNHYKK